MLQKSYSEGIFLEKAVPQSSSSFKSTCLLGNEKSYRTAVYFVPKLIPKRSYLSFNGSTKNTDSIARKTSSTYNRSCSLSNGSVKSYLSSVSMDNKERSAQLSGDEILEDMECRQNVELVPGLVMKDYSESVYVFSKHCEKSFRSNFAYDESYVKANFIVGLEVQKVREVTLTATDDNSSFTSSIRITPENMLCTDLYLNGECVDL